MLSVLEQQPTILAARALAGSSSAQRGTGLEYLENVLPARLVRELSPLLLDTRLAPGEISARSHILTELSRGRQSATDELVQLQGYIDQLRAKRLGAGTTSGN